MNKYIYKIHQTIEALEATSKGKLEALEGKKVENEDVYFIDKITVRSCCFKCRGHIGNHYDCKNVMCDCHVTLCGAGDGKKDCGHSHMVKTCT